ncbi:ABC-F family ATP-binding cassette domain-containing protein [Carnobacterium viridans]|uniref:ATP-binding cassette, subfamily F, uup n=1 Tax=Carnobacterium viridans TaxID=174587 RepID=A0A1H0XWV1_9LACT|nr:ABC-F family ATP-binding cassette domain-containing protein [Carnobacterium viridans]UDE95491.1 ABC-F family ATP-binding cassette domain-containing protein [Carnobacterium viridans]SDQ07126.1 ATP-binding cassette, subfamily F, uup [Carnobacterium viridans]
MKELKVQNLTKTYGEKVLFDDISFSIMEGERIGLIGVNGSGKTNLLNVITGNDSAEKGSIQKPKDYTISYLMQEPDLNPDKSVFDAVFEGDTPILAAVRNYERALDLLTADPMDEKSQNRYSRAEQAMNDENAWIADTNAKMILNKLGVIDLEQLVGTLSGGQRKRVGLAQVLIQEPDLLVLDEPTNHLDFETITWLEGYLSSYRGALLLVTHDRYFLDRIVNRMVELFHGNATFYTGNYEQYVVERAQRQEAAVVADHKRKQMYTKELAWMRTGAKARSTKQQARIGRFKDLEDNLNQSNVDESVEMNLEGSRLGKRVFELKDASLNLGGKVILDHFNMLIQTKDRIGISGENGAGKSTFLNTLAGRFPLDSGDIVVGETVKIAYFTQVIEEMNPNKRVISYLQEVGEEVETTNGERISVTNLLEQFLFERHTHGTLIGKLSGGEKRRLYLLKLLMQKPNVLLLDEPTNDLDIATLTVLEDYIETFPGAVISVSHDRYFLDKTVEKLLIFDGNGKIRPFYGSITDYIEEEQEKKQGRSVQNSASVAKVVSEPEPIKVDEKEKLTFTEQKEWSTIEEEMLDLEKRIETLKEEMLKAGSNYGLLQEQQEQVAALEKELEEKMNRWEYLSQYAND